MVDNTLGNSDSQGFKQLVLMKNLKKMFKLPVYRIFMAMCGLPFFIVMGLAYAIRQTAFNKQKKEFVQDKKRAADFLEADGTLARLEAEVKGELQRKYDFLNKKVSPEKIASEQQRIVSKRFEELVASHMSSGPSRAHAPPGFAAFFLDALRKPSVFAVSIVLGFFMYVLVLLFSNPYAKYISERLAMMILVLIGVIWLVFTILYLSPMDAATNIIGIYATPEIVAEFNRIHGLDRSYIEQLFGVFRGIVAFDMGISFVGNEDVIASIFRLFPITLIVGFWSLLFSLVIAVPAGVFSAIRPYSAFDYIFMFIALLGLSLPNFWQGLIFILFFSVNLAWLPPIRIVGDWTSLIMPVVVLGTSMAALVARMTRSSMLEVIKQDYITTARAKGLPNSRVVIKHVLGNALIPVVTVVGMTFSWLLGGSAVIERVFNIRGLGSHIIDRQFIPDTPVIMAGTIYIAIVLTLTNLFVDVLYAFLDPRVKSQMKNY